MKPHLATRVLLCLTALAACAVVLFLVAPRWLDSPPGEPLRRPVTTAATLPLPRESGGFVSSQRCQGCHPQQHASWHASFHRTMTQPATPESVRGNFNNVSLESRGHTFTLSRQGEQFWVELPDVDWRTHDLAAQLDPAITARTKRQIVMTTGSHHFQFYWFPGGAGNLLNAIPFVYVIDQDRWMLIDDYTLTSAPFGVHTWNSNCIRCHTTGAVPNLRDEGLSAESQVAEFGIACEACHGPGEAHVAKQTELAAAGKAVPAPNNAGDPTIVNPLRCDHRTSAQICGQCHSQHELKNHRSVYYEDGVRFRPGAQLADDRYTVVPLEDVHDPTAKALLWDRFNGITGGQRSEFWDDGTVQLAGREYAAILRAKCYLSGELTCVTCHSMHDSEPNDQLAVGMNTNQACYKCHAAYEAKLAEHTHHLPDGPAGQCQNCHMPHTTYGMQAFTRSHRIDSPSVLSDLNGGRPNACVLCHMDQTLAWAAEHLTEWYGQPAVAFVDDVQPQVAAATMYGLRGDACQRALVAWHAHWAPAQAAAGGSWLAPLLIHLLEDPYPAVRFQAIAALAELPEFTGLQFDYLAPADQRAASQQSAQRIWQEAAAQRLDRHGSQFLLEPDGRWSPERFRRLLQQRDDRPMQFIQ